MKYSLMSLVVLTFVVVIAFSATPLWASSQCQVPTFSHSVLSNPGAYPGGHLQSGDLNGDSKLDLVLDSNSDTVNIHWGDALGAFPTSTSLNVPVSTFPVNHRIADV